LKKALNDLYVAFESVPSPVSIPYCSHCVTDAEIAELLAAGPVRSVPVQVIAPYASNLVVNTVGSRDDARYFIPRILDIVIGQRQVWPDLPLVARFLGAATRDWPRPERIAIDDLIRSLWLYRLTTDPAADDRPEAASILCAAAHLTQDLSPYLSLWTTLLEQPPAASQLATLLQEARFEEAAWRMPGPWWDEEFDRPVDTWLRSRELRDSVSRLCHARPDDDDVFVLMASILTP
jgi:hypothetical protein